MTYTIYQVDAFTDKLFSGNPAAVIPLSEWIDDDLMQHIAMENNLSDTAFFVTSDNNESDYDIRWFTPVLEINLCGHATLATAFILFNQLGYKKDIIRFQSKAGILKVSQTDGIIQMDFPSWKPEPVTYEYPQLKEALGNISYEAVYKNRDLLVELSSEKSVRDCEPNLSLLKTMGVKLIITSKGDEVDFVSRFFAPTAGIDEDPVTGSAHAQLIPYWAEKTGKKRFHARQLSQRGGELWCEFLGDRVTLGGKCIYFMKGEIKI